MKYNAYKNYTSKTPVESVSCTLKKSDKGQYYKMGDQEFIYTKDYSFQADHSEKVLYLFGQGIPVENNLNEYMKAIDQNISNYKQIKFKEENGRGIYDLYCQDMDYERIRITFDMKTYNIKSVVLYYKEAMNLEYNELDKPEKPRLEIVFDEIKTNVKFSSSQFNYSSFLQKKNNSYVPKEEYKTYEFINKQSE